MIIEKEMFLRAALEIGQHGENDTLPYDVDSKFIKEKSNDLAELCENIYSYFAAIEKKKALREFVDSINIFSERLLVTNGSHGFRTTTKIHPFWNLFINGIALALCEEFEKKRSPRAHSYRYSALQGEFFDKTKSWTSYKNATIEDIQLHNPNSYVVQTDISSFYDHIYHHRLQNAIDSLVGENSNVSSIIDRILNKLSAGRSFGLPVGGQCARVLSEIMMSPIDQSLNDEGICWHRYVDDFTLISPNQQEAYRHLSVLSHRLSDFGLSLNKSKTTIMKGIHFKDYVVAQLGGDDQASVLRELDLHFDPYSDNARSDYNDLRQSLDMVNVEFLLDLEKEKSHPDGFVLTQISRSIRFHNPYLAGNICATLLESRNLDSFRASFSRIMKGIYSVRSSEDFESIFSDIDDHLDRIPEASSHLLTPDVNMIFFLRNISFCRTDGRAAFVRRVYEQSASHAVRRACIGCWAEWADRPAFFRMRSNWQNLSQEEQRFFYLKIRNFGEEGRHARSQIGRGISALWQLGLETDVGVKAEKGFAQIYKAWAENVS